MNHWFLSVACLGLLFTSPSEAEVQYNSSESATSELPFRLSSGYLIEVEGRIGSQTNLKVHPRHWRDHQHCRRENC